MANNLTTLTDRYKTFIGRLNLQIAVLIELLNGSGSAYAQTQEVNNTTAVCRIDSLTLANGTNTIDVPEGARGLMIVPDPSMVWGVEIYTAVLHPTAPYVIYWTTVPVTVDLDWDHAVHDKQDITVNGADDKIEYNAHGLEDGDRVKFLGDDLPAEIVAGTWYYVVNKTTNDFQISLTEDGDVVEFSAPGAGGATAMTTLNDLQLAWL